MMWRHNFGASRDVGSILMNLNQVDCIRSMQKQLENQEPSHHLRARQREIKGIYVEKTVCM
jgi:hypothetical protein